MARGALTFSKDIAPIVFKHCAPCHRPGQSAPFSLLAFHDVAKRAAQIADVTADRFMPPWLPEPAEMEFANQRRLTPHQISMISQWVADGAVEGDPAHLPPLPKWNDGWQLGAPDLVLTMPQPYTLGAEGKDIYRNFIIPVSTGVPRFVRAAELQPGNPRIVHHAVLQIDRTRSSRQLDEQDVEPGFAGGMSAGKAQLPDGHFIGWTPGKIPFEGIGDLAWRLDPNSDLVLQLHMRPTGKPEEIQARVGLFFAEKSPALHAYALVMRTKAIDLVAGTKGQAIEKSCEVPADVLALSVYPHAHYLAQEMKVTATLPDRSARSLLHIKNWDFNWQDEYRYAQPLFLPKGTTIAFRYSYDNTAENIRNPNSPPQRVVYGQNSTDEMAELMLQVVPRDTVGLETLRKHSAYLAILEDIEVHQKQLQAHPSDPAEHRYLGARLQQIGRIDEAISHFQRASQVERGSSRTHVLLGDALAEAGRFDEAFQHFQEADRLEPNQPETLNSLAHVLARHPNPDSRNPAQAVGLAARAVELTQRKNPTLLETLAVAHAAAGEYEKAVEASEAAMEAATAAQEHALAGEIRKRLEAYKQTMLGRRP